MGHRRSVRDGGRGWDGARERGIGASVAEVRRGVALGIRSFLVADLGVLRTLGEMR